MAEKTDIAATDCQGLSARQIKSLLQSLPEGVRQRLENVAGGMHGFAAGVTTTAAIETKADLGDFVGTLSELAQLKLTGQVGNSLGHSFAGGQITVVGGVGDYAGAFATGGLITILGTAGRGCGYALRGGELFVLGAADDEVACCMQAGDLVLGKGAGHRIGAGMQGGTLYIRGEIGSLSQDVRMVRMKDADAMRLSLLLARARVKANVKQFKVYRPKTKKS